MVTHFWPPFVSVISTSGLSIFIKDSIAANSTSLGIKSPVLFLEVLHILVIVFHHVTGWLPPRAYFLLYCGCFKLFCFDRSIYVDWTEQWKGLMRRLQWAIALETAGSFMATPNWRVWLKQGTWHHCNVLTALSILEPLSMVMPLKLVLDKCQSFIISDRCSAIFSPVWLSSNSFTSSR